MDQIVCINVVGGVWVTLHVTEQPESVTLAANLGTPEKCVKQIVKWGRLVKDAAIGAVDTAYITFLAIQQLGTVIAVALPDMLSHFATKVVKWERLVKVVAINAVDTA